LQDLRPDQGRIVIKANAVSVAWPDTMDMVVSGELNLTGSEQKALLAGDLTLVEGTYYKDVRIDLLSTLTRLTEARRAEPVPDTKPKPDWMKHIELGIAVKHRNPLLVDNNLAKLAIVPDLAISGTLATPVVTGQARVVDGQLTYRRTAFEVTRGVIDFVNPYRIESSLDIQAKAQVRDWQIILALTGPIDELALQLSSDPPESDSDILALLLVGRTGGEIRRGEGGSKQSPSQMLAGLAASEWGEDIRKKTGLDILEVETGGDGEEDEDAEDRIQLTLGKRLSRRLTLKYEVERGNGETVQRAVSEYRFLEHLLASGFQDSQGGYGGELLFRINFR
jgi:autotransporter translocation and assembly factor TamB